MTVWEHPELLRDRIFPFVGPGHYIYMAGVNRQFRDLYKAYATKYLANPKRKLRVRQSYRRMQMNELGELEPIDMNAVHYSGRKARTDRYLCFRSIFQSLLCPIVGWCDRSEERRVGKECC